MKQSDINQLLDTFKTVFVTKDDFDDFKKVIEEKMKFIPTKDEFFSKMDTMISEIKAAREELSLHSGQHLAVNDQLESHDQRIKALEHRQESSPTPVASAL